MLKRKGDEFRCITPSEVDIQVAVGCYDGSQHPFPALFSQSSCYVRSYKTRGNVDHLHLGC